MVNFIKFVVVYSFDKHNKSSTNRFIYDICIYILSANQIRFDSASL